MSEEKRPLIVGEVLFDHFPDGRRILGGAPFNVAWNLQGLGLNPLFLSAVGGDDEGRLVKEEMTRWGMDLSGLQVVEQYPTGKVDVSLRDGQPEYDILDKQAYDYINDPDWAVSAENFLLIYVGSLATRNERSRSTIHRLIETSGLPRFVDINVRQPWFDRAFADLLLKAADWVKLNGDELSLLTGDSCDNDVRIRQAASTFRENYRVKELFITCGDQGAYVVDPQGQISFMPSPKPPSLIDTVGAGDAFAAAVIYGIAQKLTPQRMLRNAAQFASRTCTLRGATTNDKEHYVITPTRPSNDVR